MDSTIYAAAAKASAVEFLCGPSVHLHHIFYFLSSPEKLLKHSTNQFFFSFLDVGEALSTAHRSRQLRHGLTANPRDVLGLGIRREHFHLAEPDIRHILFSTRSLPHFAACLHSTPANRTGYN